MDLLAKRRVRILSSYFAGHSQTRYYIHSPRYIKALSVQLGAQVLIVVSAVRSLTSSHSGRDTYPLLKHAGIPDYLAHAREQASSRR